MSCSTDDDFPDITSVPLTTLDFNNAYTFQARRRWSDKGMVASFTDNSILITGTEVTSTVEAGEYSERIIKINTEDNSISNYLLPGERAGDSKDGVIVGAYKFDDLELRKKIYRLNHTTSTFTEFASLPNPVGAAGSAIVDGNLYVFGGSDMPYGELPTNRIYRVNIENPSDIETFTMNEPMDFTFVQRHKHLIYVAGMIQDIEDGLLVGRRSSIGVFNTIDNSYQEIDTNLDTGASELSSVIQMCILEDKMYIIYGDKDVGGILPDPPVDNWDILVANLY